MDIIQSIQKLQQKPAAARWRILVGVVSAAMLIIVGFWLMATSRNIEFAALQPLTASASRTTESPFALLKATLGESWGELEKLLQ